MQVELSVLLARAFRQVVGRDLPLTLATKVRWHRLRAGVRHLPRILGRFVFCKCGVSKKILRVLLQRVHCVRVSLGIFITNLGALVLLSSREPGRKSFSLVRAHRRSISPLQGIRDLVIPGVVFASERSTRLQLPRSTGISDPVQAARLIGGNARVTFCF